MISRPSRRHHWKFTTVSPCENTFIEMNTAIPTLPNWRTSRWRIFRRKWIAWPHIMWPIQRLFIAHHSSQQPTHRPSLSYFAYFWFVELLGTNKQHKAFHTCDCWEIASSSDLRTHNCILINMTIMDCTSIVFVSQPSTPINRFIKEKMLKLFTFAARLRLVCSINCSVPPRFASMWLKMMMNDNKLMRTLSRLEIRIPYCFVSFYLSCCRKLPTTKNGELIIIISLYVFSIFRLSYCWTLSLFLFYRLAETWFHFSRKQFNIPSFAKF